MMPCSPQPPTRGNAIISMAKAVQPPLAPQAAFTTGLGMKPNTAEVPLCSFSSYLC